MSITETNNKINNHIKRVQELPLMFCDLFHPGEYIQDYILDQNISIPEFSKQSGISIPELKKILFKNKSIDEDIALKLEVATKVSQKTWLNLQNKYDQKLEKRICDYNTMAYNNLLIKKEKF